ncbi:MAG: hypothetical protein AB7F98_00910 [Novosphingobium sp.]
METEQVGACLSLLFSEDGRPTADDVLQALASGPHGHALAIQASQPRGAGEGWLELLASGLTFDLIGLAPGEGEGIPEARHVYGLGSEVPGQTFEAIALVPGPHVAGAGSVLPVVRSMAGLARELALRLETRAVCWAPAGCWMDTSYFARIVEGWLGGGAFPALGFTGMERTPDGGVQSQGLAHFAGQELRVEARRGETAADTVKLAVRAMDHIVRHGPVTGRQELTGPGGELLLVEPVPGGRVARLWREL